MPDATKLLGLAQRFFDAAMDTGRVGACARGRWSIILRAEHAVLFARETASGQPIIAKSACMDQADFERFQLPEAARWMAPFVSGDAERNRP